MLVIERDTMNAIIRAARSLDKIAETMKQIADKDKAPVMTNEEIFRTVQHTYHVQDAEEQVKDFIERNFASEELKKLEMTFDYDHLATLFEEQHDCNIADNDQWQMLIEEYCRANGYTEACKEEK